MQSLSMLLLNSMCLINTTYTHSLWSNWRAVLKTPSILPFRKTLKVCCQQASSQNLYKWDQVTVLNCVTTEYMKIAPPIIVLGLGTLWIKALNFWLAHLQLAMAVPSSSSLLASFYFTKVVTHCTFVAWVPDVWRQWIDFIHCRCCCFSLHWCHSWLSQHG